MLVPRVNQRFCLMKRPTIELVPPFHFILMLVIEVSVLIHLTHCKWRLDARSHDHSSSNCKKGFQTTLTNCCPNRVSITEAREPNP
jgi:hypothetical protein